MPADKKHKILSDQFGFPEKACKCIGTHSATYGIKEYLPGAPMFCEQIETRGRNLTLDAVAVTRCALQIFGRDRIGISVAWLADEVDINLQKPSPRRTARVES